MDIRRQSPTFGEDYAVTLKGETKLQLHVPPGFAHGFLTISHTTLFHYQCTTAYSPKRELGIRWNDPRLNIAWPVAHPVISAKDAAAPLLGQIPIDRLFE